MAKLTKREMLKEMAPAFKKLNGFGIRGAAQDKKILTELTRWESLPVEEVRAIYKQWKVGK